jgi:hypothetical protein
MCGLALAFVQNAHLVRPQSADFSISAMPSMPFGQSSGTAYAQPRNGIHLSANYEKEAHHGGDSLYDSRRAHRPGALHHEVTEWLSEQGLWVDELEGWLKEHQQALSDLAAIEQTLHRFADAAAKHQGALAAYKPRLSAFDHQLAKYLQGDERQSLAKLQLEHASLAHEHKIQREQHGQTLSLFKALLAEMDLIRRSLTALDRRSENVPALLCGLD